MFKKYSNIKFHKNPSAASQVVPCIQKDGRDEAKSCFSKFCKCT